MKSIYKKVAKELDIPVQEVEDAYKAYWKSIRQIMKGFPLKENLCEEEFKKLRLNFNIPSLGKLICTYDRYKALIKGYKNSKNKK